MPAKPDPRTADATRDMVRQLGGPVVIGRSLGISAQAVSNWYRDGVPKRHHLDLWRMALAAGVPWRPPGAEGLALGPRAGEAA